MVTLESGRSRKMQVKDLPTSGEQVSPIVNQLAVTAGAASAWSVYNLTTDDVYTVKVSRDEGGAHSDEKKFKGSEWGSAEFWNWAGNHVVCIINFYDQTGKGKHLTQSIPERRWKVAENGRFIEWAHFDAVTKGYYVVPDCGFAKFDALSVFSKYKTTVAAAVDTNTVCLWCLGNIGSVTGTGSLLHYSSSGYLTDETVTFDVRLSKAGSQRVGSSVYKRPANVWSQEATFMTEKGMKFAVNGVCIDLDTNNISNPDTDNFAPSGRPDIFDSFYVGAARSEGTIALHTPLEFEYMVVFSADKSTDRAQIEAELGKSKVNNFRAMSFNIFNFEATTKNAHYLAVDAGVKRYRPDVLCLTEIRSQARDILTDTFVAENGYVDHYLSDHSALDIGMFSKYPIIFRDVVESPYGSNELKRPAVYIEVMIDGKRVGFLGLHKWTYCLTPPCSVTNPTQGYERAVETERYFKYIEDRKSIYPELEIVVMGDHNEGGGITHATSYSTPANINSLPVGEDIAHPIDVGTPPYTQYEAHGFSVLTPTNLAGSAVTMWENTPNSAIVAPVTVDHIAHSAGITAIASEIADSEVAQTGGITKYGADLMFTDSRGASDHKAVVGDFQVT